MGIGPVTRFVVGGQILAAVLVDRFGLLIFPLHPLNPSRLACVARRLAGLCLVKRI